VPNIENPRKTLRAGALSNLAGVSTDTLRHYEKLGLLKKPPRTPSGYRVYPPEALDRVMLIRNALASGFNLRDLLTILRVRDAGGAPCRKVASLAHEKAQQLTAQIEQLIRLRDALRRTAEEWDRRLETARPHDRVNLLESLSCNLTEPAPNTGREENENASPRRIPRAVRFGGGPKSDRLPQAQASNGR
jgi:DNA-binding transcriptional MerR regulator